MKLYYFFGTMGSAKSLNLLAKAHQFEEAGSRIRLLKSSFDTRDEGVIKTRAGLQKPCFLIHEDTNIEDLVYSLGICDAIFVDESQFLSVEQIRQLWRLAKYGDIRVFCYGLKTNCENQLFESSAKLLVIADKVEELVSKCAYCDNKASTHIKINGNKSTIEVGDINGNSCVKYESVCQECYDNKIGKI